MRSRKSSKENRSITERCVLANRRWWPNESLREPILAALKANHAHRCDIPQTAALERLLITKNFGINPDCVGQSPEKIAKMAGFEVPKRHQHSDGRDRRHRERASAFGGETFAGFVTLFRRQFRGGAGRL